MLAYALQLLLAPRRAERFEAIAGGRRSPRMRSRSARCCSPARSRPTATPGGRACSAAAGAALAQRAVGPVFAGARARLPDRAAREALTVYLDAASLLLAALVALLHPLGYVAIALLAWFVWRRRARAEEKYAGLRILRR